MQAVSLSIASLIESVDIASMKLPDGGSTGNFQALLNVGAAANQANTGAQENNDHAVADTNRKNQNRQDTAAPQAVAIDVPTPIVSAPPVQHSQEPLHSAVQNNAQDKNAPAPSQDASQTTRQSSDTNQTKSSAPEDKSTAATNANAAQDNKDPKNPSEKTVRASLKDQLGNIDQVLQSIIQALSAGTAGQNATAQPVATTDTPSTTVTDGTPLLPATDSASLVPQLPAQTSPADAAIAPAAIPLLKDIQSLLQQMQQNLPDSTASAQTNTTDNLDALTQKMQQDLAQLSQLLAGQTSSAPTASASVSSNAIPVIPAATPLPQTSAATTDSSSATSDNTPSPGDLALILKTGISAIKSQLQKLKTDNESQFAQTKIDLQAQFSNAKAFFKDTQDVANTAATAPLPANNAPATTGAIIASDAQVITVSTPVNTDIAFTPPATVVDVAQSDTNHSGDSSSGNSGQNQTASQPVLSASIDKSAATSPSTQTTFSRVMDKVSSNSVLEQVSFQVKTAANDNSSKIHIQLDPTDLGKLEIKLNVGADGKTDVTVTATNRSTLDMLQRDSQGLTRALADAGLSTDGGSLSFNLRGGDQQQGQGGNAQAALTYKKGQPEEEEDVAAVTTISRNYTVNLSEGLDIKI